MEWGSLPTGKQVSLRKNAGSGQGKRAAQPFHCSMRLCNSSENRGKPHVFIENYQDVRYFWGTR